MRHQVACKRLEDKRLEDASTIKRQDDVSTIAIPLLEVQSTVKNGNMLENRGVLWTPRMAYSYYNPGA